MRKPYLVFLVLALLAVFVAADSYINTQGGNLVLNLAGGKLGVGTTTMGKTVDITGDLALAIANNDSSPALSFSVDSYGANWWSSNSYNRSNAGSGWTRTITIKSGNVGIGTTSLASKLVVAGNILPSSDNSSNLGSSSKRWRNLYYAGQLLTSSVGYSAPHGKSAVEVVSNIKTNSDGEIDHKTVDKSLLVYQTDYSPEYYQQLDEIEKISETSGKSPTEIAKENGYKAYLNNETTEYELISVSKLILAQQQAIKELNDAYNNQQETIDKLQTELCKKDENYTFCTTT
ncbi:Uncharacterised protein [uncultured archaeon]|nr:Uncharacterised protein [uncultured archaeon]